MNQAQPAGTSWIHAIEYTPDWPKAGVRFADLAPVFQDPQHFKHVTDRLAYHTQADDKKPTVVLGLESRGFILAAAAAQSIGKGLVLARKAGKIPPPVHRVSYDLEYGSATLELAVARIKPGDRVLIIDDVLATGGTAKAAVELVRMAGAEVTAVAVVLEVGALTGRKVLNEIGVDVNALLVI